MLPTDWVARPMRAVVTPRAVRWHEITVSAVAVVTPANETPMIVGRPGGDAGHSDRLSGLLEHLTRIQNGGSKIVQIATLSYPLISRVEGPSAPDWLYQGPWGQGVVATL